MATNAIVKNPMVLDYLVYCSACTWFILQ